LPYILLPSGLIIKYFETAAKPSLGNRSIPYFFSARPRFGYDCHLLLGEEPIIYVLKIRCVSSRTAVGR